MTASMISMKNRSLLPLNDLLVRPRGHRLGGRFGAGGRMLVIGPPGRRSVGEHILSAISSEGTAVEAENGTKTYTSCCQFFFSQV